MFSPIFDLHSNNVLSNLLEALWYDEDTYGKVREAIYKRDLEKTQRTKKQ